MATGARDSPLCDLYRYWRFSPSGISHLEAFFSPPVSLHVLEQLFQRFPPLVSRASRLSPLRYLYRCWRFSPLRYLAPRGSPPPSGFSAGARAAAPVLPPSGISRLVALPPPVSLQALEYLPPPLSLTSRLSSSARYLCRCSSSCSGASTLRYLAPGGSLPPVSLQVLQILPPQVSRASRLPLSGISTAAQALPPTVSLQVLEELLRRFRTQPAAAERLAPLAMAIAAVPRMLQVSL